jgi:inosine-uridine nucleoside N-ribohydrolase
VAILYSTDLFHPHDDPDDHFDLATLLALEECDVRGIVLDLGAKQKQKTGRPAVEQMMRITGRRLPCAIGLGRRLESRLDKALDQPEEFQGGVKLILDTLRDYPGRVAIFSTGSCRDVAAAFNRQPDLFRRKVQAVYVNAGNGPAGMQTEYNVGLDPEAYARMFESGLPLYWCPCFGTEGYQTLLTIDQSRVIGGCAPAVQNFFVYCLTRSQADPIRFLRSGPHPLPGGERRMWCTAALLHAAGRRIYQRGADDFVALRPGDARQAEKEVQVFEFLPMRGRATEEMKEGKMQLDVQLQPAEPAGFVFRVTDDRYEMIVGACLKNLLGSLGRGNDRDKTNLRPN